MNEAMTPLEKKRDLLAKEHAHSGNTVLDFIEPRRDAFQLGFDAMKAEHDRIVKPLIEALEKYNSPEHYSYRCCDMGYAGYALEAYKREWGENGS